MFWSALDFWRFLKFNNTSQEADIVVGVMENYCIMVTVSY